MVSDQLRVINVQKMFQKPTFYYVSRIDVHYRMTHNKIKQTNKEVNIFLQDKKNYAECEKSKMNTLIGIQNVK